MQGAKAATGAAPAAPAAAPASPAAAPQRLDRGDNLDKAEALANQTKLPHGYDLNDASGAKGKPNEKTQRKLGLDADAAKALHKDGLDEDRLKAIAAGDPTALKWLLCSDFTAITLALMGVDLLAPYRDPATQLPVASRLGTKLELVTLYMVVENWPQATAALLDVGAGKGVTCNSAAECPLKAGMKWAKKPEGAFLYVPEIMEQDHPTFKGRTPDSVGQTAVGGAAAVVSLGGSVVEPSQRRPGDFQQSLKADKDGKLNGAGHSSQVWSVSGRGLAYCDPQDPTTPQPASAQPGLTAGWYEGLFTLDKKTNPAHVRTFETLTVRLVDQNIGRGMDGSRVDAAESGSKPAVLSVARLPGSVWATWRTGKVGPETAAPLPNPAGPAPKTTGKLKRKGHRKAAP